MPLLDEQLGYYRPALMVLFGAVALLLVIGVLNVASLLLTRALSREKEIAVRVALGAAPRQLVTQLMAESLVLSVAGAVVGIVATLAALPLIVSFTPVQIPRLEEAGVDLRALGLCLGVVARHHGDLRAGAGAAAAAHAVHRPISRPANAAARRARAASTRCWSRPKWRMACALLVSSALLVRTVGRMMETPTGVNADDVLTTDGAADAARGRRAGARRHDRNRVGADCQHALAHPRRDPPAVRRHRGRRVELPAA